MTVRHRLIDPQTPGLPREGDLHNVNGPSVIRTPSWVPGLGRYHLYFAHHHGQRIRLAFADAVTGPWTVHDHPALHIDETPAWGPTRHIASPDVHVDEATRTFRMYFHSPVAPNFPSLLPQPEPWQPRQETHVAMSPDGVDFTVLQLGHSLAPPYLRMWPTSTGWFGMAMPDVTLSSPDGLTSFTAGPRLLGRTTRHVGIAGADGELSVFFTRVGDSPEHIVAADLLNHGPVDNWRLGATRDVLWPLEAWEGAALESRPSTYGAATTLENALRDPYPFDDEGIRWLFYVGGGEQAIGAVALDRADH